MTRPDPILAVDGGGTRCRMALRHAGQLTRIEVGAVNLSTDFEAAVAELRAGLDRLMTKAGVQADTPARAYLGLAGMTGPEMAARLAASLPLQTARIEDDRPAALRGALGPGDGALIHCGTGSFLGLRQGGNTRFAGGWGPRLGDEASAQWVARRALARSLDVADGLGEETPLSRALLEKLEGTAGVVAFAARATPSEMGALAPLVTAHAAQGDALARAVMIEAVTYLARMLEKMGWNGRGALCLTGGIGPEYRAFLPEPLRLRVRAPAGTPLDGALALAEEAT